MQKPNENLVNLEKLLAAMSSDHLGKEDFVKHFEVVINLVKQMKQKNIEELDLLKATFDNISKQLKDDNDQNFAGLSQNTKDEIMAYCKAETERLMKAHEAKMQEADEKMAAMKPGKDADEEAMCERVMEGVQAPIVEKIAQSLPELGAAIRDGLELLQGDERLEISAIRGLRKLLKRLDQKISQSGGGGFNYGAVAIHFIDKETPTGTVNGVNAEFTITNIPSPASSLSVFINGLLMSLTEDYTFSGRTITFLTPPPTGSIIKCDYRV